MIKTFAPQRGPTADAIDTATHDALTTTAYIDTGSTMASTDDTIGTTLGMR